MCLGSSSFWRRSRAPSGSRSAAIVLINRGLSRCSVLVYAKRSELMAESSRQDERGGRMPAAGLARFMVEIFMARDAPVLFRHIEDACMPRVFRCPRGSRVCRQSHGCRRPPGGRSPGRRSPGGRSLGRRSPGTLRAGMSGFSSCPMCVVQSGWDRRSPDVVVCGPQSRCGRVCPGLHHGSYRLRGGMGPPLGAPFFFFGLSGA